MSHNIYKDAIKHQFKIVKPTIDLASWICETPCHKTATPISVFSNVKQLRQSPEATCAVVYTAVRCRPMLLMPLVFTWHPTDLRFLSPSQSQFLTLSAWFPFVSAALLSPWCSLCPPAVPPASLLFRLPPCWLLQCIGTIVNTNN